MKHGCRPRPRRQRVRPPCRSASSTSMSSYSARPLQGSTADWRRYGSVAPGITRGLSATALRTPLLWRVHDGCTAGAVLGSALATSVPHICGRGPGSSPGPATAACTAGWRDNGKVVGLGGSSGWRRKPRSGLRTPWSVCRRVTV